MTQYIKLEDIQAGDTIKVTESREGLVLERTGKVGAVNTLRGVISTEEGGTLWHHAWDGRPTFQLIDRPKPPLPSKDGTIILAYMPQEKRALVLRNGGWEYLDGSSFYHGNAVKERPWKLLKLVEA